MLKNIWTLALAALLLALVILAPAVDEALASLAIVIPLTRGRKTPSLAVASLAEKSPKTGAPTGAKVAQAVSSGPLHPSPPSTQDPAPASQGLASVPPEAGEHSEEPAGPAAARRVAETEHGANLTPRREKAYVGQPADADGYALKCAHCPRDARHFVGRLRVGSVVAGQPPIQPEAFGAPGCSWHLSGPPKDVDFVVNGKKRPVHS